MREGERWGGIMRAQRSLANKLVPPARRIDLGGGGAKAKVASRRNYRTTKTAEIRVSRSQCQSPHCVMMGRSVCYLSLRVAVCVAAALVACPSATAGWPVDSSFYDEIKRVVYGDDATESPPPPPLSLPSSQASIHTRNIIPRVGARFCQQSLKFVKGKEKKNENHLRV